MTWAISKWNEIANSSIFFLYIFKVSNLLGDNLFAPTYDIVQTTLVSYCLNLFPLPFCIKFYVKWIAPKLFSELIVNLCLSVQNRQKWRKHFFVAILMPFNLTQLVFIIQTNWFFIAHFQRAVFWSEFVNIMKLYGLLLW